MDRVRTFCRTMWAVWAVGLVLSSGTTLATPAETKNESQAVAELKPLEAGLTLPVQVGRTLRAGKAKPGTVFEVKTTQRVPVSTDAYLNHGARIRGEVVTSDAGDGTTANPSRLTIRFTQLSYQGRTVPLETRAVAMANLMAVNDTFLSMQGGADRGNPSPASWTTRQVGGDEVARSGWVGEVVGSATRTVGSADYFGVYSLPVKLQGAEGLMVPRAMGVFSTTAAGLYGYDPGDRLESAGGLITITNPERQVVIRNGDNLLLEVVAGR
jgi:hypothetical protein